MLRFSVCSQAFLQSVVGQMNRSRQGGCRMIQAGDCEHRQNDFGRSKAFPQCIDMNCPQADADIRTDTSASRDDTADICAADSLAVGSPSGLKRSRAPIEQYKDKVIVMLTLVTRPCEVTSDTVQGYWNDRFQVEEKFEWLGSYEALAPALKPFLKISSKILVVGCGNSGTPA